MGGASYTNVIYQIRKSTELETTEKELALTLLTVFNDLGVLLASITAVILSKIFS